MDILLATASASLAYALPVRGTAELRLPALKSVLFLSFLLFSLSILDASPPHWLWILTRETFQDRLGSSRNFDSYRSVAFAYYAVLWSMAFIILIVQPAVAGTKLWERVFDTSPSMLDNPADDQESEKKRIRSFAVRKDYPLVVRMLLLLVRIVVQSLRFALWFLSGWLWALLMRLWPLNQPNGPGLTLHASIKPRHQTWMSSKTVKSTLLGCLMGPSCIFLILRAVAFPILVPSLHDQTLLAKAISLMVALGIVLSSILNGFGSVSLPYSCLAGEFLEPIRPEAVSYAEHELDKAAKSLEERKFALDGIKIEVSRMVDSPVRRKGFSELGDEVSQRRKQLKEEVAFMESLVHEMEEDLNEMRQAQYLAAMSRTPLGRVRSSLGIAFSLILIVRLISATLQILPGVKSESSSDQPRVDVITRFIIWSKLSSNDAELLSQVVSLILTALLSASQIRYFLRTALSINSWFNRLIGRVCCNPCTEHQTIGHVSDFFSPVLAGCMGCYCLAAIVLTKIMLPKGYQAGFSAALGESNDSLFRIRLDSLNTIYVASALASMLILGVRLGIQRQNTYRHIEWMDHQSKQHTLDP